MTFQLENVGVHHPDDEEGARLVKFPGWERVRFINARPLELPETIYFEANFETLKVIGFPLVNVVWPIMSRRMLDTLQSAGEFEHRAIPVVMLDDTLAEKLDAGGKVRPGAANLDFVAVHLTSHIAAFDWERSEYTRSEIAPDKVWSVKRLVFKDIPLPPLFRLTELLGPLFVSAEGRAALEKAGIRGIKLIESERVL
ncbi:MAG: hypothetical protein KF773_35565 [Deltaproteobacteria bacterium]|nr:hypothetical protein [Deltaproteobacteria bacterium]